jgi:hypothetical protein
VKTTKEIIDYGFGVAEIRLRHTILVDSEDLNRVKDLSIWFKDGAKYHKVVYRVGVYKDTNYKRLADFIINRGPNIHITYKNGNHFDLRKANLEASPLKLIRRKPQQVRDAVKYFE